MAMAEKEQEHLRIRLGARLLKRIDSAREKTGRTRTDEIEARLLETFSKSDLIRTAEMAVYNVLVHLEKVMERQTPMTSEQRSDFYKALAGEARKDLEVSK
jgi:hypothetical protein